MKPQNIVYDVVIIGAGPAGLMAAVSAARRGKTVLILEANSSPGRKILISGKGRCNVTNVESDVEIFLKNFSKTGIFLRNCFNIFFNADLVSFFENSGVRLKKERGGRMFPESDSASDILFALMSEVKRRDVAIATEEPIEAVARDKKGVFRVAAKSGKNYAAHNVVIATGGMSYPETGSRGDGFQFARLFGHTIIEPKPGLVGLNVHDKTLKEWQGINLKNVSCAVLADNKKVTSEFGEMIFTHFGVSGPIILDVSAACFDEMAKNKKVEISLDLKPALTGEVLEARLLRELEGSTKDISNVLKAMLPSGMTDGFCGKAGIKPDKKANQITKEERRKLVAEFKGMRFTVVSTRPLAEAIVTRGGVSTKEIDPKTMRSRLVKGLFFAGEVIDVDARTGGFNLQAAFSTGYAAGGGV